MKTCITCSTEKDVMEFYMIHDGDDSYQPSCIPCRKSCSFKQKEYEDVSEEECGETNYAE